MNNKGFTLVEVIISIAVLSIISVIFLQLFVKAKEVDDSAYVLDRSVMMTNSAIERLKGLRTIEEITSSQYFEDYEIKNVTDMIDMSLYLDENLEVGERSLSKKNSSYQLVILLEKVEETKSEHVGLYLVECSIIDNETGKVIHVISTKAILGQ